MTATHDLRCSNPSARRDAPRPREPASPVSARTAPRPRRPPPREAHARAAPAAPSRRRGRTRRAERPATGFAPRRLPRRVPRPDRPHRPTQPRRPHPLPPRPGSESWTPSTCPTLGAIRPPHAIRRAPAPPERSAPRGVPARAARSRPSVPTISASDAQYPCTNPPFRPLGPAPHVSASTSTTRLAGSRSLQRQRRPQPGVAAADDADVRGDVSLQRRCRLDGPSLVEPPRRQPRLDRGLVQAVAPDRSRRICTRTFATIATTATAKIAVPITLT